MNRRRSLDALDTQVTGAWLLVEEVMTMLGVSRQRVSFLAKQGRLKVKHDRRLLPRKRAYGLQPDSLRGHRP